MKYIYLAFILSFTLTMFGQQLNGVVQSPDGNAVEFATIFKSSSTLHVHSDAAGAFQLNQIYPGDTLIVQHFLFEETSWILTSENIKNGIRCTVHEEAVLLDQVVIKPTVNSLKTLHAFDNLANPVQNSQELLRMVPGLFIGQHAGGGKAEQIFLRGFDIDHGTDVNIAVDGMPVNMVSHAHGQGYADMHFIVPEVVSNIVYGKGPYDVDKGNFATAGYVELHTIDNPANSMIGVEAGSFRSYRVSNRIKLIDTENQSAYVASEYVTTDGPFESPQGFHRKNFFGKYSRRLGNNDKLNIWVSDFSSRWDASGQIPNRAVSKGWISRFGAIDDTEGGQTGRRNINLRYLSFPGDNQYIKTTLYFSQYDFELYSNFTFFLRDSIQGDQIKQKESRDIWGWQSEWNKASNSRYGNFKYKAGVGFRYDNADEVELSDTRNRTVTEHEMSLGNIDETNLFWYQDVSWEKGKFQVSIGSRLDVFSMLYENLLAEEYLIQRNRAVSFNPKLTAQYTPSSSVQFYLKAGRGFHSNDTRVVTGTTSTQVIPPAMGADLGVVRKLSKNLVLTTALWYLFLDQEFVYVGDEAIVELSGKTRRMGVDVSLRYQPFPTLFLFSDVNYAHARSIEDQEGNNLIPLAPWLTSTGGIQYSYKKKITAGLKYRYMADRSANEDASIMAAGYTILDGNINYTAKKWVFGIEIHNILNSEWNETQFATRSRLKGEATPVDEIHFTPGAPFSWRGKITFLF